MKIKNVRHELQTYSINYRQNLQLNPLFLLSMEFIEKYTKDKIHLIHRQLIQKAILFPQYNDLLQTDEGVKK